MRSYHTVDRQDFQIFLTCYFIIERQFNVGYIRAVALFVLQKLDLKMILTFSKRQNVSCFANSFMATECT